MKKALRYFIIHHKGIWLGYLLFIIVFCFTLAYLYPIKVYLLAVAAMMLLCFFLYVALIIPLLCTINDTLFQRCAPQEMLQFISELFDGADVFSVLGGGSSARLAQGIWIDRGILLFSLGLYDEALENYRILEQSGAKLPRALEGAAMLDLSRIAAVRGDEVYAQQYIAKARACFKGFCKKVRLLNGMSPENALCEAEAYAALRAGEYDRAEALYAELGAFLNHAKRKPMQLYRVDYERQVGALYFQTARIRECVPHMQFASENGGETVFAKEAAGFIDLIASVDSDESEQ
ncbi:MAG: hypothetical protein Q4E21_05380 [Clostridia bacterium]|nr:hypothetical protein [Clostridia bacterium]